MKFIIFLFLIFKELSAQSNDAGVCPSVPVDTTLVGICANTCIDDSSCRSNEKCCSNACGGKTCTKACVPVVCTLALCPYGINYSVIDGCQKCDCAVGPNPCALILCKTDEICQYNPTSNQAFCVPKPNLGECRTPSVDTSCVQQCSSDANCGVGQRCCSNGCGKICTNVICPVTSCPICTFGVTTVFVNGCPICACIDPCKNVVCTDDTFVCQVNRTTLEPKCVPKIKPGVCPTPSGAGVCAELCSSDTSCAIDEKCCSNGCGRACTKVSPCAITACRCPYGVLYEIVNGCQVCKCREPCKDLPCASDSTCIIDKATLQPKCVPINRPGSCPVYNRQNCGGGFWSLFFWDECKTDSDCRNPNQKCCADPCRKVCVDTCVESESDCKCDIGLPTLVNSVNSKISKCNRCTCENPCQNARCGEGKRCVVEKVQCIKAPCRPVASCVAAQNSDPCKASSCKSSERCVAQSTIQVKCLPGCPRRTFECFLSMFRAKCTDGFAYDQNGCQTCDCFRQ